MIELRKFLVLLVLISPIALHAQDDAPNRTLIRDVNVWDGLADDLQNGRDLLIEGNKVPWRGKVWIPT
jgi:hypothetical protein